MGSFNEQMVMVAHQDIGMEADLKTFHNLGQEFEEMEAISVVDDPVKYGQDFFKSRAAPLPEPPKPKRRPGRPPRSTSPKAERSGLTVIDGDGGDSEPRK